MFFVWTVPPLVGIFFIIFMLFPINEFCGGSSKRLAFLLGTLFSILFIGLFVATQF